MVERVCGDKNLRCTRAEQGGVSEGLGEHDDASVGGPVPLLLSSTFTSKAYHTVTSNVLLSFIRVRRHSFSPFPTLFPTITNENTAHKHGPKI